ncbi:hypothetical protein GCU49_22465, partial [Modestobacter roseus]|nr:hypothetical protein [Modestobacter roseus]
MTMPRQSRAERRREGQLPSAEETAVRRPPARPAPAAPVATGRRRSDAIPSVQTGPATAVGGAPVVAGRPGVPPTRREAPAPATTQVAAPPPAASGRASAPVPADATPRVDEGAPSGRPAAAPAPADATQRVDAGRPSRRPAAGPPAQDVTQRVSGAAPAGSAWGATSAAAPPAMAPTAAPAPAGPAGAPAAPARRAPEPEPAGMDRLTESRRRREALEETGASVPVPEVTGTSGGRAAQRAERQAADAARRKA